MAVNKISITRLMAARKGLEDRVVKATGMSFIGIYRGDVSKEVVNMAGKSVADATATFKGNFDRVNSLIELHRRYTSALIMSNAQTKIKIGNEEMFVAEAIERKKSISMEKRLLATAIQQNQMAQAQVERNRADLEVTVERQLAGLGDKNKITPETRQATMKMVKDTQQLSLIDPVGLADWAQKKMDTLHVFETEIDFVLSESNAKTEVEIDDGEPAVA